MTIPYRLFYTKMMIIFHELKKLFIPFSILFFFMACRNTGNNQKIDKFPITYAGTLPCADCSALEVQITFNANHTYTEKNTYKDTPKGDKSFKHQGKWKWTFANITGKNDTLYVLNPGDSLLTVYYLMKDFNRIEALTKQKKMIHSPFNNTLTRIENPINSHH